MARDNAETLRRRNERAQSLGFTGYGQQRRYRAAVRSQLAEHDISLGISPSEISAIDQIGSIEHDVRSRGSSGLSRDELYETVRDALLDAGVFEIEMFDENGDVAWAVIRQFYPRKAPAGN